MGNKDSKNIKKSKNENKDKIKIESDEGAKNIKEVNKEKKKEEKIIFFEAEKEEEKIIIEDFSKELKIHPKKIKQLDKEIFKRLYYFFDDYKCSICLFKIIVNIERKQDNILYITTKCCKDHKETKPLSLFLQENKFRIEENFTFYDFVPNEVKLMELPIRRIRFNRWEGEFVYYDEYLEREDELLLICFKCKTIYDVKKSYLDKVNHEHFLFKYYIKGYGESDKYNCSYVQHLLKYKDQYYLEQKIKEEKKYYNNIKELFIKFKLENDYISYLKEIEDELYFFEFYYKKYSQWKGETEFINICNLFNHTLIPFKINENDINKDLEKQIELFYKELKSLYSLNTFDNREHITINKYEQHWITPPFDVIVSTSLEDPYFSFGGNGLLIYKKEENQLKDDYKKYQVILILEIKDIDISAMIYLGNRKMISGGYKGFNLIHFKEEYKSYNMIFHIMDNIKIDNIIKGYDESFISYGDNIPIWKWKINNKEDNIEKLFILNPDKKIINLCEISNKYFAYQTNYHIHIINMKTFQQKLKIEYRYMNFPINGLRRYSDEIIGVISEEKDKIEFFNVETGEKLYEINDNTCSIKSFLKTNREKDENEIITISEHSSGMGGYGVSTDFILHNNKWEKLSETGSTWTYYIRHIYETDDKTILISGQKELYVLFYPTEMKLV